MLQQAQDQTHGVKSDWRSDKQVLPSKLEGENLLHENDILVPIDFERAVSPVVEDVLVGAVVTDEHTWASARSLFASSDVFLRAMPSISTTADSAKVGDVRALPSASLLTGDTQPT